MSVAVYPEPLPPREAAVAHTRTVLAEVSAERLRQMDVEGYAVTTDDVYIDGELASAAGAYALDASGHSAGSLFWPWPRTQWKPGDRRASLIKAAALAVAEIERLDRAAAKPAVVAP